MVFITKHTPTPWSAIPNTGIIIRDISGMCDQSDSYKIGELSSHILIGNDEAVANAAFIVEAVNNHETLKARVKELEEINEELKESLLVTLEILPNAKIKDNAFNVPEISAHNEMINETIRIVRAALHIKGSVND